MPGGEHASVLDPSQRQLDLSKLSFDGRDLAVGGPFDAGDEFAAGRVQCQFDPQTLTRQPRCQTIDSGGQALVSFEPIRDRTDPIDANRHGVDTGKTTLYRASPFANPNAHVVVDSIKDDLRQTSNTRHGCLVSARGFGPASKRDD